MYKNIEEFLKGNFKDDYSEGCPDDYQLDEINSITYKEILVDMLQFNTDMNDIIGDVDSAIRECLFDYLELNTKIPYNDFYNLWLKGEKSSSLKEFEEKYLK